MVIVLDHCWNERVSAQPFLIITILDVPAQKYFYSAQGLFGSTILLFTDQRLNIDTTTDDGTSSHLPSRSGSDPAYLSNSIHR